MKPEIIINKLKLDEGFEEEKFEINLHRSTVLSIAIIIIGGLMLADGLPELMRQIYVYFQMQNAYDYPADKSPSGYIIFYFIKVFIGYYMVAYHRLVVNFIEGMSRKNA
jgi:hypothetical protein